MTEKAEKKSATGDSMSSAEEEARDEIGQKVITQAPVQSAEPEVDSDTAHWRRYQDAMKDLGSDHKVTELKEAEEANKEHKKEVIAAQKEAQK